jgi:hypothetical protein
MIFTAFSTRLLNAENIGSRQYDVALKATIPSIQHGKSDFLALFARLLLIAQMQSSQAQRMFIFWHLKGRRSRLRIGQSANRTVARQVADRAIDRHPVTSQGDARLALRA